MVGDELGRIGWGNNDLPTRIEQDRSRLRTIVDRPEAPALSCRLEKGKWTALPKGATVPRAEDSERGKTQWAVISDDSGKAASSLVQVMQGSNRIDEVKLLASVPGNTHFAYAFRKTPEGGVAIRYKVPTETEAQTLQTKTDKNGNPIPVKLTGLEVAWANVFEGKTGRTTIQDAGTLAFGEDYYPNWQTQSPDATNAFAQPTLVATVGGGVFLRPHGPSTLDTYFIDRSGKVSAGFKLAEPPSRGSAVLSGGILDNKPMSISLLGAYGFARYAQQNDEWDMISLGPGDEGPAGFDITQTLLTSSFNGSVYLTHSVVFKSGGRSYAEAFPVRADGPVLGERVALPTQTDMALVKFKPCTAADRSKSPRIVAPAEVGTQRPVVIETPDGNFQSALLSAAVVGYGTPQSPCASVVEAFPVPEPDAVTPMALESALVLYGDLEHSWFFRQGASEAGVVEAKQMRCKVDRTAPVPLHVSVAMQNGTALEGGFLRCMGELRRGCGRGAYLEPQERIFETITNLPSKVSILVHRHGVTQDRAGRRPRWVCRVRRRESLVRKAPLNRSFERVNRNALLVPFDRRALRIDHLDAHRGRCAQCPTIDSRMHSSLVGCSVGVWRRKIPAIAWC
ncbi:MAG: hypothetical protein U0165_03185 [Polyangiaceae bacterium]